MGILPIVAKSDLLRHFSQLFWAEHALLSELVENLLCDSVLNKASSAQTNW